MPIHYAVLKGRPTNNRLGTKKNKHYQVLISANGEQYRIAVNVESGDGSEVAFLVRAPFEHPIINGLAALEPGLHKLPSAPGGMAIDFIRGNIGQPWEFQPLPYDAAGPDNDLNEKIDAFVQRAMSDENAMIYAFGAPWGPEPTTADKFFGFKPGQGIHDIHMNQGNPPGQFHKDNGVYQDGALLFNFPDEGHWTGIFMKFQTQAWHTDDVTGDVILAPDPEHPTAPHTPIERDQIPTFEVPDGLVRIIAAYVNDTKTPEHENVTLLNTADVSVNLEGWAIADRQKQRMKLTGTIDAGATRVVDIVTPVALSNRGGIITLLDERGIKVHGVSYTKEQAQQPGRTIPFQS
ncbi:DUF2278 family protein [Mesorhizobium sp. WSM3862]|uniref:DUF2278 family protein n=1 Tax=Mesorhizobium sp. WSM3862 TaxID=632858 RepID=UPI000BAF45E9|nr:DUF2278 family protein [Mesorhizobium sp. WSM3862]PBB98982.1 hypothetical protein CK224_05145 [Mesorhizobium sp. WSM3862]